MKKQVEIITDRLLLKSVTPSIVNTLFKEKNEAELKSYFGVDDTGYERLKNSYEKGGETYNVSFFYFLVCDKETKEVMGDCGFHTWNTTHQRAELFYSLNNERYKRKGVMTEAVRAVLNFGFNELQLHRVAAFIGNDNTASRKILERFQFTKEGIMREDYVVNGVNEDSVCYSLLKWEFMQYHPQK